MFFTPDGKEAEDKLNAETIARPVRRVIHIYERKADGSWAKARILSWNKRFVFLRWHGRTDVDWASRACFQDRIDFGDYLSEYRWKKERAKEHAGQKRSGSWDRSGSSAQNAALLGVKPDASEDEVNAAFRRLARLHHPDAHGDPEEFKKISAARDRMLTRLRSANAERVV